MAKQTLKVAIIGAGMIANAGHIPAWKSLKEDVDLVGIASGHEWRAQRTARRHGIPYAFGDWQRMLAEIKPDVVSVATPNEYHQAPTIAALRAGAHVLCEKPITTSHAAAVEMYEAAQAAGRVLLVAQTSRFTAGTMAAKEIAGSGALGEMYYAEASVMRRRGVPTWGVFHIKEHSGGGPVYDLGVHALDMLIWIMGNPRAVAVSGVAYTRLANRDEGLVTSLGAAGAPVGVHDPRPYDYREFDVEDMATSLVRLENGAAISLKTSWAANVPDGTGSTFILGTKGGLRFNPLTLIGREGPYQADVMPLVPPDPDIPFYGHWREAAHLVRVIRGEEEPLVRREEVLNVIRILEGLYRSAQEGREVRLD